METTATERNTRNVMVRISDEQRKAIEQYRLRHRLSVTAVIEDALDLLLSSDSPPIEFPRDIRRVA
jgi:hypothetical protein